MSDKIANQKHFCGECGREMVLKAVPANEVGVQHYAGGDISDYELDTRYDRETGKLNLAFVKTCPLFKKHWFFTSAHDQFCIYEGKVIWTIKV